MKKISLEEADKILAAHPPNPNSCPACGYKLENYTPNSKIEEAIQNVYKAMEYRIKEYEEREDKEREDKECEDSEIKNPDTEAMYMIGLVDILKGLLGK